MKIKSELKQSFIQEHNIKIENDKILFIINMFYLNSSFYFEHDENKIRY